MAFPMSLFQASQSARAFTSMLSEDRKRGVYLNILTCQLLTYTFPPRQRAGADAFHHHNDKLSVLPVSCLFSAGSTFGAARRCAPSVFPSCQSARTVVRDAHNTGGACLIYRTKKCCNQRVPLYVMPIIQEVPAYFPRAQHSKHGVVPRPDSLCVDQRIPAYVMPLHTRRFLPDLSSEEVLQRRIQK